MKLPSQPILGLIEGMEVLQYLAATDNELSGVEISKTLGIEKTKVSRILKTLAYLGFVVPTEKRTYILGPAVHVLSAQMLHGSGLIKDALQYLIELTELEVTVAMGVLWRDKVAYTYHWSPGFSPTEGLGRVELFPFTQSSIGIVLSANKADGELEEILTNSTDKDSNKSKAQFFKEINFARENGYATTVWNGKKSIALQVGNPAYSAIALAHIDPALPDEYYLNILSEKVNLIEDRISNQTSKT
ncbi:IclR family transcriptional regulator [Chondrinema litorale]|uniref:IclR family transcriptional regulator n=1 Tax=Chondrinema litorale TaxID=2994555 RepID=UPI0025432138|nr:helix-turn-helix domain-containing protein [Chondrinema litorale]UZR96647.1 helix-turn-helix domain-containing protein [Chondrinema litorale]